MFFIVAEFVREDGADFIDRKLFDERIVEYDALGFSEAREIRVRVFAALRRIHDKNPARFESRALHKIGDARLERTLSERSKFIKKRGDEARIDKRHEKRKRNVNACEHEGPCTHVFKDRRHRRK